MKGIRVDRAVIQMGLIAIFLACVHQFFMMYQSYRLLYLLTGLMYFNVGAIIKERKILKLFLGVNFCWWLMVRTTTNFYGAWYFNALDLIYLILPLIIGYIARYQVQRKRIYVSLILFFAFLLVFLSGMYFLLVPKLIFDDRLHKIPDSSSKIPDWFYEATSVSKVPTYHEGKVVYLDFWFTKCGYCFRGFKELQELHDYYEDHPNVSVYAIHNGSGGKAEIDAGIRRVRALGYDFPILVDSLGVFKAKGLAVAYPTQLLVDKEGKAKYRLEGYALETRRWKKNWVKRNVAKLLGNR